MPRYTRMPETEALLRDARELSAQKYWRERMVDLCREINRERSGDYRIDEAHAWPGGYLITVYRRRSAMRLPTTVMLRDRADWERELKGRT